MNNKEKPSNFSASIKKNKAKIILIISSFLIISVVNFFNVATSKTISTFNLDDFEIGMISDRTIISPKSFPLDMELNVQIEEGEKIIRKGFKIEEEDFKKLQKLSQSKDYIDLRLFANNEFFLFLLAVMWILFFTYIPFGRKILFREQVFQVVCFILVYLATAFAFKTQYFSNDFTILMVIPAVFFVLIVSILYGTLTATIFSLFLAFGVYNATNWNLVPFLFTFASCFASSIVVRKIEKRMDMVVISVLIAFINVMLVVVLSTIKVSDLSTKGLIIGGVALNGFLSGILALGFLTPLELLLNTASIFRLMDLSDLNTPFLRRMLVTAPGTYQHSLMVSQLAETACREIGANPLVARVGGYYHDIGKIDQPEYFTENQYNGINKHDDLAPNLSVSVIRSHVRHGVEKAHQLHLPKQIIDIIEQHHGNGVISWFYEKAKKEDPNVNINDFTYYGNPPLTKEAAVVMLADTVESACRSLDNPTEERLEKFIQVLINSKIEQKQLNNCDLTFSDITKIKETFLQILVGYYHSRIKYPSQKDPDKIEDNSEKNTKTQKTGEKTLLKIEKTQSSTKTGEKTLLKKDVKSEKESKTVNKKKDFEFDWENPEILSDKTLDEVKKNV